MQVAEKAKKPLSAAEAKQLVEKLKAPPQYRAAKGLWCTNNSKAENSENRAH